MDALADGLDSRMAFEHGTPAPEDENESTLRAREPTARQGMGAVFSPGVRGAASPLSGASGSGLSSSLPTNSTISKARGSRTAHLRAASRPIDVASLGLAQRAAKTGRGLFGITDYSGLPTKRSRGRRPIMSRDVGLADDEGRLADCVQSVPGGSAFDPTLNPESAAVEFCETTKTGKPKKIFVCKVTGCGKVFKRSEHLKRHVRSIHTDVKPFRCPWMPCAKLFNRHDNLNQHLRVHRLEQGGAILNGLSVGSDGVLRREVSGEYVNPAPLGLRNVELVLQEEA